MPASDGPPTHTLTSSLRKKRDAPDSPDPRLGLISTSMSGKGLITHHRRSLWEKRVTVDGRQVCRRKKGDREYGVWWNGGQDGVEEQNFALVVVVVLLSLVPVNE